MLYLDDKQKEAWAEQIVFWRQHLDIAIEQLFEVHLTEEQCVIARQVGTCDESGIFCSRGFGKTWLTALVVAALCVLYPETKVLVFSSTIAQACLVLMKLEDMSRLYPGLKRELRSQGRSDSFVKVSKSAGGTCFFKNGSSIEALHLDSARGRRANIIVIDELLEVNRTTIQSVANPILNFKREFAVKNNFEPESNKIIYMSSAFSAQNSNYETVMDLFNQMQKGNKKSFLCALPYTAAVRGGLTDESFFENEKRRLSEEIFNQEYMTWFCGGNKNSVFSYQDIDACRTLVDIETQQPKNSNSRYVISVDLATSSAKTSDNTVISVLKFYFNKENRACIKLVLMKSYNGKKLEFIANEVRKLFHLKFPSCEKIIYDAKGLGISFNNYFESNWEYGHVEYPALFLDDKSETQKLKAINATISYNQELVNYLKAYIEKRQIEFPVHASIIKQKETEKQYKNLSEEDEEETKTSFTVEEKAVYFEVDAFQLECGNIVEKITPSGSITYDTQSNHKHKDRYSSVAMGVHYIHTIENKLLKYGNTKNEEPVMLFGNIDDNDCWGGDFIY